MSHNYSELDNLGKPYHCTSCNQHVKPGNANYGEQDAQEIQVCRSCHDKTLEQYDSLFWSGLATDPTTLATDQLANTIDVADQVAGKNNTNNKCPHENLTDEDE